MDDSLPNVEQQISDTYVEQEIKIEPEVEQDPLEYVNVVVKSERVESCEPELDELNSPDYVNVPVKSEVFESCEPESIDREDSTHTRFCNELNEKQNVVDSSNYIETEDNCIINKNIDITKPCKDKELSNNPNKGGSSKRRCGKDDCSKQAYKGGYCIAHGGMSYQPKCSVFDCSKQALKGGHCIGHGGILYKKKCGIDDCSKQAKKGGFCVSHGGQNYPRKTCGLDGCFKQAKKGGYCISHGGTHILNKCGVVDCPKYARKGGYCITHGGKNYPRKLCGIDDCPKLALRNGYCIAHMVSIIQGRQIV